MFTDPIQPLFTGQNRVYLPSCHSTNKVAAELLASGKINDETLIITDHQTTGKGQRGSHWESEPYKNLTFSLILFPYYVSLDRQFLLTQMTSLAILNTLSEMGLPTKIKWPNDIYCNGLKIAGILIENTVRRAELEATVIGVGLNVNQKKFNTANATSICLQLGFEPELETVLNSLLDHFQKLLEKLRDQQQQMLIESYFRNLYRLNEWHYYWDVRRKEQFKGLISGVDMSGKLKINSDCGPRYYDFKEIEFVE